MEPELMKDFARLFNLPETHPTTPETAAYHEAAHTVVAASFGLVPVRVSIEGERGGMELTLPARFETLSAAADRPDDQDPVSDPSAPEMDIRVLGVVLMASMAYLDLRSLPERWTCASDWLRAEKLVQLRPELDLDPMEWRDEAKVILQRPEVAKAMDAVARALLKGPLAGVDVAAHCAEFLPPVV